ncbi:MAG: tol-pal system YbgF family protein, partial [Bdellovibrionales bacterium]
RAIAAEGNEVAVPDQVLAESYQVLGDALLKQDKGLAAVESFQKLLERFEEKMPLASVRFKTGEILFDRGDFKGASEVWRRLEGTENDLLWKIGKEKLENSQWSGDYKKYINRIPAMTAQNKKETKK